MESLNASDTPPASPKQAPPKKRGRKRISEVDALKSSSIDTENAGSTTRRTT
ncbi:hypothetical protein BOTBODRAFT_36792 [Botryobasidium botryosum FD-172 SS1]|uniref:Uncharacterized protein n=1 Tax=Botryobasidium botryosum (strain FD-172 SS1) TaxID=930990 RepID=A0A067M1P5_BOTB1|nr:hypothetical protein BOTBODRAFT_36792 [Botryobasidium botryosum FD-172 SS1]